MMLIFDTPHSIDACFGFSARSYSGLCFILNLYHNLMKRVDFCLA
jgi:hypothetical protein